MTAHPAETFRTIPQPVADFGLRTDPIDIVLRIEQPSMPLLPSVDAQVRRSRHGLDLVVRLAAENGLNVIGWDLSDPTALDTVIGLTTRNAALAHLGLHDCQVTTQFGMNSRPKDRDRVESFRGACLQMERIVRTAITILGAEPVKKALTQQVRSGIS